MSRIQVTDEQIKAAQAGNQGAMWEIVSAFDPMLNVVIRSVAPGASTEDAEDYLQEARAVLIQHIRDYDSSTSSAQLSTYVYRAARRAIAEADVMNHSALTIDPTAALRVRRALAENSGDVEAAWATFRDADQPTKRMSRELFLAMLEALMGAASLDATVVELGGGHAGTERESLTLSDLVADPSAEIGHTAERRALASWLMSRIPQRQSLALRAFYGVGMTRQDDGETCTDMGIKAAALRKLRSNGVTSARRVADAHDLTA